ncbi:unnamed protein product [Strongylus vulgaris]|uniref:MARVEL domain-containing protein n=1 Tax=Strongylus vulgaris TaxID=40348 RepID=A0A3P7ISP5_STRVU|nr:unnamed protein product [Strongylus vulgaris]
MISYQLFTSGLALIAFLVCGGVETWYATGFDHMSFFIMSDVNVNLQAVGNGVVSGCAGLPGCQIQFVVKGWAVAAAFYFLGGLLYLIDMGLVFAKKDKWGVGHEPTSDYMPLERMVENNCRKIRYAESARLYEMIGFNRLMSKNRTSEALMVDMHAKLAFLLEKP